jgi:hypothetical protein
MKAVLFALLVLAAACGGGGAETAAGAQTPAQQAAAPSAEDMNKSKCSACHAPREPGQRTRAELEVILKKHRDEKRAKLGDDEWAKITDYLARK